MKLVKSPQLPDTIDAIRSIVWYNGLTDYIRDMIDELKKGEFSALKYWNLLEVPHDARAELHFIAMIVVLRFGNYGTSPRGGWVHDTDYPEQAIRFLEKLIEED